jgi:molecular chaperone HtpG
MEERQFIQMTSEDIGGALISILSEGLYTDPMHAVREYVQNSIDAGAQYIVIKMTGNSVIISDDGCGMNLEELKQARQVGISKKDYLQYVGFRGIGIYSGFGLCDQLVITTQKLGERHRYILTFDFAAMRRRIAEERKDRSKVTSLTDLLSQHSWFESEPGDPSQHYTTVELQNIAQHHLSRLYDVARLEQYLLRNVPIDFHDDFEYKDVIAEELARLPGYRAAQVLIQADGQPDILVAKPPIPALAPPRMGYLRREDGKQVAFYWWCRHKNPQKIPDEYSSYRGFTLKLKGFTIGDNRKLRRYFRRGGGTLYEWVVGEIYVLDEDVIPNAERDDFQSNQAREALYAVLDDFLVDVQKQVDQWRKERRATEEIKKAEELVSEVRGILEEGEAPDYWKLLEKVDKALEIIKKQRRNLPTTQRSAADKIRDRAKRLRDRIRKEIESPTPPEQRRARRARKKSIASPPFPEETPYTPTSEAPSLLPQVPPKKRPLLQVIQEAGGEISEGCYIYLKVIEEALLDVLEEEVYQDLMAYIEARLTEEMEE